MSTLRKAGMRRWLPGALICALLVAGAYATLPMWSVALARAVLAPAGIGVEELVLRRPGIRLLEVERLTLTQHTDAYALRLQGRGIRLRYHWRGLWQGQLDALHAEAVAIAVKPLPQPLTPTKPLSIPLEPPSALLARLPVAAITLPLLTVDAALAAGDWHVAGSADYLDGVLQLQLADTRKPQLSAHLRVDRRDQIALTVRREQTLLAQLSSRIEQPRHLQGALQVQLEPLSALLQGWGVLDRATTLSGALTASWHGTLPAVIDAASWRNAALTGELEAHLAAGAAGRHGEVNLQASYTVAQGLATVEVKRAAGAGTLPVPALLATPLALPAAQPLQIDARTAGPAMLRIALQPLQLKWSGAMALTVAAPQRSLQAALTLTDPTIDYDAGWHLATGYQARLSLARFDQASFRASRAHLQLAGSAAGSLAQGSVRIASGAQLAMHSNRWPHGATGPISIRSRQPIEIALSANQLLLPAAQFDIGPATVTQGGNSYHFAAAQLAVRDGAVDRHALDAAVAQMQLRITRLSAPAGPYRLQPVAVQADLKAARRVIQGNWSVRAPDDLFTVRGTLRHALADGRGEATATLSPLTFKENGRYLPALFAGWPYPLDFSGGQLGFNARAQWRPTHWSARLELAVRDVAGFYKLNLFKGLTTNVRADYADGVLQMPPTPVSVDEVDAGIALRQLRLTAAITAPDVVRVQNLQAQLLGGRMYQNDFSYRWQAADNTIPLLFEAIELNQLLALEQNIEGSGVLDGTLPVTLSAQGIAVQNGSFRARAPGGVIRYGGTLPQRALTSVPALQMALDSLKNFHYSLLRVSADYAPTGELALRTELHGRNPELVAARPVHFNLDIRENIPDLLRSIQLSRDISDNIEKRIQDFYQHQTEEPAR